MIKLIIVLFNFAFKRRLVNDTRAIAIVQAGTHANRLASVIDRAGNIKVFTKNRASRSFFFSKNSKETCSLIFLPAIKKVVSMKHPTRENRTYFVFIKSIIGKRIVTGTCVFSSICIELVNIKTK